MMRLGNKNKSRLNNIACTRKSELTFAFRSLVRCFTSFYFVLLPTFTIFAKIIHYHMET